MGQLPIFRGYTVDFRLKEFRKLKRGKHFEFIPFESPTGRKLLKELYLNLKLK